MSMITSLMNLNLEITRIFLTCDVFRVGPLSCNSIVEAILSAMVLIFYAVRTSYWLVFFANLSSGDSTSMVATERAIDTCSGICPL